MVLLALNITQFKIIEMNKYNSQTLTKTLAELISIEIIQICKKNCSCIDKCDEVTVQVGDIETKIKMNKK